MKLSFIPGILLLLTVTQSVSATTYYVDKSTGSDSNSGRQPSSAWKSISMANKSLTDGDQVIIGAGSYSDSISPVNTGTSDSSRITYVGADNKNVSINGMFNLAKKSYITISNINIKSSGGIYSDLSGANHVIIEKSVMTNSQTNPGIKMQGAYNNILRQNKIIGTNLKFQDLILITGNSHHNLIEHNHLAQGSHTVMSMSGKNNFDNNDPRYNIVRYNYFISDYHHSINIMYGSHHNVFDGNFFAKSGTGQKYPSIKPGEYEIRPSGEAWHAWQPYGIYRFNTVMYSGDYTADADFKAGMGALSSKWADGRVAKVTDNRIYHNLFYKNYNLALILGYNLRPDSSDPQPAYGNNKFVNNIIYDNGTYDQSGTQINSLGDAAIKYVHSGNEPSGDIWQSNLIENQNEKVILWKGTPYSISQATDVISSMFVKNSSGQPSNIGGNPKLVKSGDPATEGAHKNGYYLTSESPGIDRGSFLTTTRSSGSGRSVPVNDARFFIDGFGIVDGDTIQIGIEMVTITDVDYGSNTLTIDKAITWGSNEGVSFPFKGSKPDMGVYEFPMPPRFR